MNLNLTNKNALVCGSTQGIGKASAKQLAEMGANITLVARNEDKLKAVLTELDTTKGQTHNYIIADFQNPIDLGTKITGANQEFHILINNTGGPAGGPVFSATLDQFEAAFTQHLKCNHILVQAVVPGMKNAGFGRIINIISTSVKQPLAGLGVSNTIRGAVANWSKTLAGELGEFGITVNNVLPGATGTERLNEIINNKATKSGKTFEEVSATMKSQVPANRLQNQRKLQML